MKQKRCLAVVLFFLIIACFVFADNPAGPEDANALFPSVVLQIEDLSIETIDSGLLPEEKLMTFELESPLPGPGEISIPEPTAEPFFPVTADSLLLSNNKSFYTELLFGAGLQNNILSEITFYRLGLQPVIRLFLSHENADGFAYKQIGLGYGNRRDEVEGEIKFQSDAVTLKAAGGFRELEQGLQEQAPYFSVINQFSQGNLFFAYKASDIFTLSSSALVNVTSFHLTGASPPVYSVSYPPVEYLLGGEVKGELRWEAVRTNLDVAYKYRMIPGDTSFDLHRFSATLGLNCEPADWLGVEAAVGFFTSSEIPYLIPFTISLRGFLTDWFSLGISGGYRIQELNLSGILSDFDYADFPAVMMDNHGWFGNLDAQVSFEHSVLLILDFTLSQNAHYLSQGRTLNVVSGLFPETYTDDAVILDSDIRLRFPIFPWLSLNSVNSLLMPFTPGIEASGKFGAELAVEEVGGTFGVKIMLSVKTDFNGTVEFPFLDVSAYIRVFENIKLIIEGLDLLSPLAGETRYAYAQNPYIAPGIRARFKLQVSL
jgi:hypothetical protein